jgi:MFS family permease
VWYGGQFYALFFLEKILQLESTRANLIIAAALVLGTPFFVVFGALSDRIGRKKIVLGGCLLAVIFYFPIFRALTHFGNPALETAVKQAPVVVLADTASCSFQFDPVGKATFSNSCDIAKTALARAGVPYANAPAPAGAVAIVRIGETAVVESFEGRALAGTDPAAFKQRAAAFNAALKSALTTAGYPAKADAAQANTAALVGLCCLLVLLVTMVYGPIAAWLVELFPPRIRYSSMSLPYHIGNGWFGGFLPVTAFAIVAATGNIYSGLWYPVIVAGLTVLIGGLFLRETRGSAAH